MMKLLVDLGNTRIKWALCEHAARSQGHTDFGCGSFRFSERGSARNTQLLSSVKFDSGIIDEVVFSSVASVDLLERHIADVKEHWTAEVTIVKVEAEFNGFLNRYDDIAALGVDRWVASVGAHAIYPNENIVLIDAGTAVTIDMVGEAGEFLGGVIMPGIRMMHRALIGNTAQIRVQENQHDQVIGRNTQDCVSSGVRLSVVGGVDRAVAAFKHQLSDATVRVMVCGGDAERLINSSHFALEYNEDLLFIGLAVLCGNKFNK